MPGFGFSLAGRVMLDPGKAGASPRRARCGWAGAASTWFFIDPREKLVGLVMSQYLGSKIPLADDMRNAIYSLSTENFRERTMRLYIANKNYSSWSFRPWIAMKAKGVAFEEVLVPFDDADGNPKFKRVLADRQGAGAGRRRNHGVGIAVDPGISARPLSRAGASGRRMTGRGRPCPLGFE